MSRSGRLAVVVAIVALAWGAPDRVLAHAIGGTFQLPVPLWLYLIGAAAAVAASFVAAAFAGRGGPGEPYAVSSVDPRLAAVARSGLRVIGLAWWYGAIFVAFAVGDISPLPAVLLWVGIWVGLPIVAAVAGNPWPSLSPFRTSHAAMEWAAQRLGADRFDLGLRYPPALARWPAVALLLFGIWAELVLPGSAAATTVGWLMVAYTALTLTGMALFGQLGWLRHAELFEVMLAWFGRIGVIGRRATSDGLCAGCGENCPAARCIDCPECSTAADDDERQPVIRPPFAGLTDVGRAGWSDAAFIVIALAGVTYDGLRETPFGAELIGWLLPPAMDLFGTTLTAFLLVDTAALIIVVASFLIAFGAALAASRLVAQGSANPGRYASTLLPIAAGYLVAHYLTLVIQGAVWLPSLLVDPLMSLAPQLDWIPVGVVWYLSVVAIVGGHVAGIVLAHRVALDEAPGRATLAGVPMVALMIGYTILSLWIIAQPIVVDPGAAPAGLARIAS